MSAARPFLSPSLVPLAGSFLVALGALLWAYSTTLAHCVDRWSHQPIYSHGYLVPIFALALLWLRRDRLQPAQLRPTWWGLPFLLFGVGLQLAANHFYFEWFESLSFLPAVLGIVLLSGGWAALRWSWPAVLFLVFMLPLPYTLEVALQAPLQRLGTVSSCYVMQTLGMPAYAKGNEVFVYDNVIQVGEACSGLGMTMVFVALVVAVSILSTERPLWERLLVLLSALPIAVIANVIRITTTGLLHAWGWHDAATLLHDKLSAFFMMPLALGMLWFLRWYLSRLFIHEIDRPMSMGLGGNSVAEA